ncbi:MOSC domain-containing protein [Polynucleobacter sp. AP-Nino-20-G2]|uniref:MOSC domain-containing protein n=1 Tax=Polynucleobacter sp. AP-Nino-20-G2 TaxID=2576917 RepID=UPI001BFD68ED|nr:MOSC domain-containing protein [Polynucleobacter sp. AP-Nino-20-G2]QWE17745.1 sulfurase [Polynucleobacter sp. AP-Nino-20-G2]
MEQIQQAHIIAGQGIQGDRYAAGIGAFSVSKPKIRHISLITLSGIADANQYLEQNTSALFAETETRRNIVILNFSSDALNTLVGKVFYLGGLAFKGTELCVPCERPANLLGKQDFLKAFQGRGGLRAEALESGTLLPGDALELSVSKSA